MKDLKIIIGDLLIILLILLLVGCKPKMVYVPVETRTTITNTVRDTVLDVRIEEYRDSIITPDSTSYLSNRYGYSFAEVRGGLMRHSLSTWPGLTIPVKSQVYETIERDSIQVPYPVEVPVYINKLTWLQKLVLSIGYAALIGLVGLAAFRLGKKKLF